MTDFNVESQECIDFMMDNLPREYIHNREVDFCNRNIAGLSVLNVNMQKNFLFGMSAGTAKSYEYCIFDVCEDFNDGQMQSYLEYIKNVHDTVVDPQDPDHEFTFITAIIFTKELKLADQTRLRRFSYGKRYRKPLSGFTLTKVAVIDLKNEKIYTNSMGADMRKTLKTIFFK